MKPATSPLRSQPQGFTLVEVMVALLILGMLTALGYGTYRQARISAERTEESQKRTREIEFGLRTMVQDFSQIAPRPIREPIGEARDPALRGGPGAATLVDLTRVGWSNTAGVQRGTLQRVSYRLDKDVLKRSYQAVLDPTLSNVPIEQDLLTKVKSLQIRFLDMNHAWQDQWPAGVAPAVAVPPPTTPATGGNIPTLWQRPVAVEINVEFKDWGKVRRLIEVAG